VINVNLIFLVRSVEVEVYNIVYLMRSTRRMSTVPEYIDTHQKEEMPDVHVLHNKNYLMQNLSRFVVG